MNNILSSTVNVLAFMREAGPYCYACLREADSIVHSHKVRCDHKLNIGRRLVVVEHGDRRSVA